MLSWNEHDFVECLGVLPEVSEDHVSYLFRIEKDGLCLELTVFPYDGGVYIDIYRSGIEKPIFYTQIKNSSGARYIKFLNGWECLEIAAPHRNIDLEENWIVPMGARVQVNPHISVEVFQPPA